MKIRNPTRHLGRLLCAAALLAGLGGAPAPAAAGTIGIRGTTLIAGAEAADGPLALTATVVGTDLMLIGADLALVTPGCTGAGGAITCALAGFSSLVIIGSSSDDAISLAFLDPLPFAITVLGGAGDDVISGSVANEALFGGAGDDTIIGGGGADLLVGGSGINTIIGDESFEPEPVFTPLPRDPASVPAPGGLVLLTAALGALSLTRRRWAAR